MKERKEDKKKPAQKRLEDADTQIAETRRAFNVAMAKTTHGLIEMVERGEK